MKEAFQNGAIVMRAKAVALLRNLGEADLAQKVKWLELPEYSEPPRATLNIHNSTLGVSSTIKGG